LAYPVLLRKHPESSPHAQRPHVAALANVLPASGPTPAVAIFQCPFPPHRRWGLLNEQVYFFYSPGGKHF